MPFETKHVFTLHVDLTVPHDFGSTINGDSRFIPIVGGTFSGPNINGTILPGGGDWNTVRSDGVVHVYAKYSLKTDDGVMIQITNEGFGRSSKEQMKGVFGDNPSSASLGSGVEWYTKTNPKFEVALGKYDWLTKAVFVGDLLPPERPNHVKIMVYEIL